MKPPRPWLAALLNLVAGSPIGQIYAGHLRRSLIVWFIGIFLLLSAFVLLVTFELNRFIMLAILGGVFLYQFVTALDAFFIARRAASTPRKKFQKWWFYITMAITFYTANYLTASAIKTYVCESFRVPGRAMSPTILHDDRILVDRFWANPKNIKRYDVVVFRSNGMDSPLYVMRVIGLPGEKIEIRNRVVYINDETVNDPKAIHDGPNTPRVDFENYGPKTIPEEHFFALGDNRMRSNDSRFLGTIPLTDYYGHARWIFFSRDFELSDEQDISEAVPGAIHWDRIGLRIQ
jgi:signal peptidase I